MIKQFIIFIGLLQITNVLKGQVIIIPIPLSGAIVSEHGFLPGKKIELYPTISKYNLSGSKFRVEIYDNRNHLNLSKITCSEIPLTNATEFAKPGCINLLAKYVDTLFHKSNAIIDAASGDTLQIWLEGIDTRLIGFGEIHVHGLCQLSIKYHNNIKKYCVDITDEDKNSPISSNAFVTRKTATRIFGSVAMREVIEGILKDLSSMR